MYLRKGKVWIGFVAVGLPNCFEAWQDPRAFFLVCIRPKVIRNMFQVKTVCVGMYCTLYSLRCNINRCVKSDKRSSGIRTEMKCANKIIAERRNVKFNSSAFRVSKETGKQTNKQTNEQEMTTPLFMLSSSWTECTKNTWIIVRYNFPRIHEIRRTM